MYDRGASAACLNHPSWQYLTLAIPALQGFFPRVKLESFIISTHFQTSANLEHCSVKVGGLVTIHHASAVVVSGLAGSHQRVTTDGGKERRRGGAGVVSTSQASGANQGGASGSNNNAQAGRVGVGLVRGAFRSLREAAAKRFAAMFYGATVWDPWLIVAQIACLQCLFYLSLGFYLWLLVGTHVPHFTLKYFFDFTYLSASSLVGWCCILAFLANAITW